MLTDFTPLQSLLGGAMIGAAAVLLMLFHGRIAGLTGILTGLIPPRIQSDWPWRVAMLGGMVASPAVYAWMTGTPVALQSAASPVVLILGGVVAGVGVHFGSGCTSGHGVCGLARFSRRSLTAVATFMASTAVTVFVVRHLVGA